MSITKTYYLLLVSFVLLISSCKKDEVTSITLNKPNLTLLVGQNHTLQATVTVSGDLNKFPVTWESNNPGIVSVDSEGHIKALQMGTASIIVKAGDKSAFCTVRANNEFSPVFNRAYLVYYGDTLHTGVSNLYILQLRNENEAVEIFLNVNLDATDSLPSGKYNMLTEINTIKDLKEFTIIPGLIEGFTTYYSAAESGYGVMVRPIAGGNITVTPLQNKYYRIAFVFTDIMPAIMYGVYTGPLEYYNYKKTKQNGQQLIKSKIDLKMGKVVLENPKIKL